ncbi:MAG: hypothetical protein JWP91_1343 [Fibrobacteres bacterium]|nr:hypothetical protein [Fibrobacterota bacterium]
MKKRKYHSSPFALRSVNPVLAVLRIALPAALATFPTFAQTPDSLLNRLSAAEKAAGWQSLFDGSDKDAHWRTGLNGTANTWIVEDGALANPPGSPGSELFTRESYSDFELSMEWKLSIKGNSGIFFRVSGANRQCSGSEYAILDDVNGDDRSALGHMPGETAMPIKRTASDYDLHPTVKDGRTGSPYVALAKPFDQWNRGAIWANGALIENWLNGEKVAEYTLGDSDWVQRFRFSKYYDLCPDSRDTWARHPSGLIGMQDHGGGLRVWFRNIKIRPFIPGGKLVSPLITPTGGKFDSMVKVALEAAITGSAIYYTLDGSNPGPMSPVYKDGLILMASTTLKAITIRKGFVTSDVATATFTLSGTPTHQPSEGSLPGPAFHLRGDLLRISNPGTEAFQASILGVGGERNLSFSVEPGEQEFRVAGLRGVHLLRFRMGNQLQIRKLVLP